jgi:hypothetical protein
VRLTIAVLAAISSILVFSTMKDAPVAEAAVFTFEVQATGAEENPAVTNYPGSAFARFTFNDVTRELTYAVTVSGISTNQVLFAHIHRGARGVNGPIVHFISAVPFTQAAGTIALSEADVADLRAGNFYLNVHSVDFPGGFARGQMILPAAAQPTPVPTAAPPTVAPPSTGDAGLLESSSDQTALLIGGGVVAALSALFAVRRYARTQR